MATKEIAKEIAKFSDELKREMKSRFKEMQDALERDYRNEMREMKTSMEHMSNTFDGMYEKFTKLLDEQSKLRSENEELKRENAQMKTNLRAIDARVTEAEQYMRNRNLEIKGVPPMEQKDVATLLSHLGRVIDEPELVQSVDIMHSVPVPNSNAKNIVVQFKHRQVRDRVLEKCKKKRITTSDLGSSLCTAVFVNEHLCPALKRVLGFAIAKKRQSKLAFVWVRNGKVYIRKSEADPAVCVCHTEDVINVAG